MVMKELLIYLISISSFTFGWEHCETIKQWNIEKYPIAYTQSNDTIVRICDKDKLTKDIIIHELWHIYYFQTLTEIQRKEWEKLYDESLKKTWILKARWFVNLEATENKEEDFAETFTAMVLKNYKSSKTLFIKEIIWVKNTN